MPSLGNTIYFAIAGNAAAIAAVRNEFTALALSFATDANASAKITSATVNGQTFTASATMTQGQRLKLLRWVIACLDAGGTISPTVQASF